MTYMSAQPHEQDGHDVIHLGGQAAVVVPLEEYWLLKALKDQATQEELDEAWMTAAIEEHEAWKAAGCPGGFISHEEVMAQLGLGPGTSR